MPVEVITKSSADVIIDIKRTFGDESDTQIDDSDIIRWINRAQMEITMRNPEIGAAVLVTDLLEAVADYPLQATVPTLLTVQSIHTQGRPIKHMSFQDAETHIMNGNSAPVGNPSFWFERAGVVTIYPVPQETISGGLKFYFNKRPDEVVTNAQPLSVSDHYYNAVVAFCLEQAYLLDENAQLANAVSQKFDQGVTLMKERTETQTDVYPSIGVIDEYGEW